MKITPKFLKGGSFISYFAALDPLPITKQLNKKVLSEDNSKKSKTSEVDDKEFYKMMLLIDGLPNETLAIIHNLKNNIFLNDLVGESPESLRDLYLDNWYYINLAKYNKNKFDESYKEALKNGSMNEPAISEDGQIWVQNRKTKEIKKINLNTLYKDNNETYNILSVSYLLQIRSHDPNLAFSNDEIFNIANTSFGFNSFLELINHVKNTLGKTENRFQGNLSDNNANTLKVIEQLKENPEFKEAASQMNLDLLYEYKYINSNLLNQIKNLISYLVTTLPKNAKIWAALKIRSNDEDKASAELIGRYLLSGNTEINLTSINPSSKSNGTSSNNELKDGDIKLNTAAKFYLGYGEKGTFVINPGTTLSRVVLANTMPLTNSSGNYLGPNSSIQQVLQGEYSSILDINNVSMGMSIINPSSFNHVILQDGNISSIDFPCIELDNGSVVPNLSKENINSKIKADTILKQKGINVNNKEDVIKNYELINKIYKDNGLIPAYKPNGELDERNWRRFGVINCVTDDKTLNGAEESELFLEVKDDNEFDNISRIIMSYDEDYSVSSPTNIFGLEFFGDSLYKGTLWIPIKHDTNLSLAGEKLKESEVKEMDKLQQESDIELSAKQIIISEKA